MSAKYTSTEETTNYARICRLVIDVFPDVFRELLVTRLPFGLPYGLSSQKGQIISHLNRQQKKMLYPSVGVFQGSEKDMDVSLLYILLRNLGNITPHGKGWGNVPDAADRCLSANIDRLRIHRNEIVHANIAYLSNSDFRTRWADIRQSVEDIQNSDLKTGMFVQAVDSILTMTMDPDVERKYITLVKKIEGEISDMKDEMATNFDELKGTVAAVSDEVGDVRKEVTAVSDEVGDVRKDVTAVSDDVGDVRKDVTAVSDEVGAVRKDVTAVSDEVGAVRKDVTAVSDEVGDVRKDVGAVREDVSALKHFSSTNGVEIGDIKDQMTTDMDNLRDTVAAVKEDVDAVKEDVSAMKQSSSTNGGRNPKWRAVIDTTRSTTIDQTTEPEVISTQALEDAKEMIRKNSIVLIKGASGDGKTLMGYQLLKWLMDGDNKDTRLSKDPVQLYSMAIWDEIVEPNTQLAVYIDDVSGEIAEDLKKREVSIKSTFCGKLNNRSNCLVLNVRDEIFKSTQLSSCECFKQNIIDLRGKNCITIAEKKLILESYVREIKTFPKGKEYETVKLAPDIGFPLCCRLYRDVLSLQKEGVNFFKHPFHFMEITLKKLPKEHFSALLFLFLNDGRVKELDLDPKNSKSVNKKNLDEAFQGIKLDHADKIRSLRKSLDLMLGSLVVKRTSFFHHGYEYKFCHDSVHDTVVLLYGKDTPIGFIENCPLKFLRYISTSKSTAKKILISPSNEHMYKRLVRKCESDVQINWIPDVFDFIVRLDLWSDTKFLRGFIRWLSGQNYDNNLCHRIKCGLLNGACSIGLEDCVTYLLSVGVTPNNDTPFRVVESGSVQLLRQLLKYDVIRTARARESRSSYSAYKINVLHEACLFEREEMVNILCDTYPHLVYETDSYIQSALHLVAMTGNCGLFQTVERMCRDKVQHKCETEDDCVVQRSCVCGQYKSRLVDGFGWTLLHYSCESGHRELSLYLCKVYPELTTAVDNDGKTILHCSCMMGHRELSLELCKLYPALTTAVDNNGKTILHYSYRSRDRELSSELRKLYPALC
ncbi:uncharacterized protein LOC117317980 [Pecten maximus]|uniref:uncharacterized protein LOC117317980 n=1 Tax=Pecten maximus TaxID=6579 RepID=UPI0014583C6A|nr:uncharacterized protein LOC117317980 [Pecten maximus]